MKIVFSIILFFTNSACWAYSVEENGIASVSINPQKNPETGLIKLNTQFYFDGQPYPKFDAFFQTFSLSDFTKLPTSARTAVLSTLLAFRNYPQESKTLDSTTLARRQEIILQNYLDTADAAFKAKVYDQAMYDSFYVDGSNAIKLFELYRQLDPERAMQNLCGQMGNTYFYLVNSDKTSESDIRDRKIRADHLQRILSDDPILAKHHCSVGFSLEKLLVAIKSNKKFPENGNPEKVKEVLFIPPLLKECNKSNIQKVLSMSIDHLSEAENGTISFLGSNMSGCKIEGKIVKTKEGYFFNSMYSGKSPQNIPIKEIEKAWGITLIKDVRLPQVSNSATPIQKKLGKLKAKGSR